MAQLVHPGPRVLLDATLRQSRESCARDAATGVKDAPEDNLSVHVDLPRTVQAVPREPPSVHDDGAASWGHFLEPALTIEPIV